MNELIENLTSGILLVSRQKFLYINQAAKKILGWDLDVLNKNFTKLRELSENLSGFSKLLTSVLNSEYDDELLIKTRRCETKIEGQYFNVYLTKLEDNYLLELSQIIYQDMNQTTHELKRPIQNIKTLVETLMIGAKNDPEKLDEYLVKLNQEADRLGVMVSDMLSLSHLINGVFELSLIKVKLKNLVDKIFEQAERRIQNKKISLINQLDADLSVEADQKLIEHLIANLVDNAIKYNNDPGKVIVKFDNNKLIVSDTGLGMTREDAARVFDQFYRIKDRTHIQGTGLGLSIVKAIVELHGWEIEIESELGNGTSFVINL
jgi:two-component system, OmpR family, phosphate regulon sensor histidine kinase PhoR